MNPRTIAIGDILGCSATGRRHLGVYTFCCRCTDYRSEIDHHPRRDRRMAWAQISRSMPVGDQAILEAFLGQRLVIEPSNKFQLLARKWNLRSTTSLWTPLQGDVPHCRRNEPRGTLDGPIQGVQPVLAQCVSESIEEEIAEQSEDVFHAFQSQLSNS